MIHKISYSELNQLAGNCAVAIRDKYGLQPDGARTLAVYPIPRGGVPATLALLGMGLPLFLVDDPRRPISSWTI